MKHDLFLYRGYKNVRKPRFLALELFSSLFGVFGSPLSSVTGVARFSERCDAEAARRGTGDDPAERMKLYADVMGWELTFPPVPAGKVAMHLIPTERLVSTHVEGRHFSREMLPQVRRGAAPGRRTRMISRSRGRARRPTH